MIDTYKYMKIKDADEALEFGIKLSLNYERNIVIDGHKRMFMCSLLNPNDNEEKRKSNLYKCLKLEVEEEHCFIADGGLYAMAKEQSELMLYYYRSVVPAGEYTFGTYRNPECLIGTTILPSAISIDEGYIGAPLLVENSCDIYLENIIERLKEKYRGIDDALLYCFFENLAENGIIEKIACGRNKYALYRDKEGSSFQINYTGYDDYVEQNLKEEG